MTTPNPNLSELRRLAEGATPGPYMLWCGCKDDGGHPDHGLDGTYDLFVTDGQGNLAPDVDRAQGRFWAACDPATILALLDMVENAPARDTET